MSDLMQYLRERVDNEARVLPWQDLGNLPIFLRSLYSFHELTLLGKKVIMLQIVNHNPDVKALKKHAALVKEITQQQVVFLFKEISWYRKKSLLTNRIPFLVTGGQMYLPFLGLDLEISNNHQDQAILKRKDYFSASTQQTYLYFLFHKKITQNATSLAKEMGFTIMTASRALNELHDAGLLHFELTGKTGRSKEYRRIDDPDYFQRGKMYLSSPVIKEIYLSELPKGLLVAGLEALSSLSMLNPPESPVRAIGREEYISKKSTLQIINNQDRINDERLPLLQIWSYDPRKFSTDSLVDRMSLYASLIKENENDERTAQALSEALQKETWYTD